MLVRENESDQFALFTSHYGERLKNFPKPEPFAFTNPIWSFVSEGSKGYVRAYDFIGLNETFVKSNSHWDIVFQGYRLSVSTEVLAKALFIDLLESKRKTFGALNETFQIIALTFCYLSESGLNVVRNDNLADYFSYLLTHDLDEGFAKKRQTIPSWSSRLSHISFTKLSANLRNLGCGDVLESCQLAVYQKALNEATLTLLDMTLSDYIKGKSFNYLGLDIGKHYIDHCSNVFESKFQVAYAFRKTRKIIETEGCEFLGLKTDLMTYAGKVLMGRSIMSDVDIAFDKWSEENKTLIEDFVCETFRKNFNAISCQLQAFKQETFEYIGELAKLPDRFDTFEFLRAFMVSEYIGATSKSSRALFLEYVACLQHCDFEYHLDFDDFKAICHQAVRKLSRSLSISKREILKFLSEEYSNHSKARSFSESVLPEELASNVGIGYVKYYCNCVEAGGITLTLGLTGWRKSEFGFPLNAFKLEANHDVVDNYFTPWRVYVNWTSKKGSKTTPLKREVTLQTFIIANLLNKLNSDDPSKPALYLPNTTRNVSRSESFLDGRVTLLWADFCRNYEPFTQLDALEQLKTQITQTEVDKSNLKRLEAMYDLDSSETKQLLKIRDDVRDSAAVWRLVDNQPLARALEKYRDGELEDKFRRVLEQTLSEDSLEFVKGFSGKVHGAKTKRLRSEILSGISYPTPHAFRHIWAEAVLRRYRGDVGKFIRANFKHLDERFFMAYLRDKETNAVYQVAKRTVINSIVRQELRALSDQNRDFAGQFERYLSKAVSLTKVVSPDDYEKLAHRIASDKVADLKANPWSTCFLRFGTENIAKCSKNGTPQRHNASPELCLGCINADIASGNFNGIVVYTKHDIDVCRNPNLPIFIKEPHIQTVRLALKRVKELRRNSENKKYDGFIDYLTESLEMAAKECEVA